MIGKSVSWMFASALLAVATGGLEYKPAPKARVDKEFTTSQYLDLVSQSVMVDGQEQTEKTDVSFASKSTLRVRDEVRAVDQGRPTSLRRFFEQCASDTTVRFGKDQTGRVSGKSPLEGVGVVFTWVEDEQDYGKHYDALEVGEGLLENLAEDLDFRSLLPGRDVQEGEEWTLAPAQLTSILALGGSLGHQHEGDVPDPLVRSIWMGAASSPWRQFEGKLEGKAKARLLPASSERAGKHTIAIEFAIDATVDLTNEFQTKLSFTEYRAGLRIGKAVSTATWKGTGELVWDPALGHFSTFAGKADETFSLRWDGALESSGDDADRAVSESLVFEGTWEMTAKATAGS